jgi:hypothetical protein
MTDDLDRMLSGGAKSAFKRETPVGTSVSGIIMDIAVRQATEYGTGNPLTFPSGDAKEQILVTIRAEGIELEDAEDDGVRTVYIKGWGQQRRAFQEAAKRDGKPGVGDRFTATFTGLGENKQGGFPPKEFEYRIQPMQSDAWGAPAKTVDRAKVEQLRGMGMKDEAIAAALEVNVSDLGDVPF